jgi:hypothetical protein
MLWHLVISRVVDSHRYAQASFTDVGATVEVLESHIGLLENAETTEYLSHFHEHSSKEKSSGDKNDSLSSSNVDTSAAS